MFGFAIGLGDVVFLVVGIVIGTIFSASIKKLKVWVLAKEQEKNAEAQAKVDLQQALAWWKEQQAKGCAPG